MFSSIPGAVRLRARVSIRAILFDLGNVVAFHDNPLLFRRLGERAGLAAERVGELLLQDPLWDAANRGELDTEGIRRAVCQVLRTSLEPEEFLQLWCCHFRENAPLFPIIEALQGWVTLGLLSNTNRAHIDWLRPRLPILEAFDYLFFSCDVGKVKPDPGFYLEALEQMGAPADQTAFFDDMPPYVEAARALGIHGFVFTDVERLKAQLLELGLRV